MMPKVLILNGPNLNMLGAREPEIYGSQTLDDIRALAQATGHELGLEVDFRQSNSEGQLIDWVHEAITAADGVIVNGGAYSHTSIALLDALRGCGLPVVEVHLSNLFRRESYRHHSYVSEVAQGLICGFGAAGYALALAAIAPLIGEASATSSPGALARPSREP